MKTSGVIECRPLRRPQRFVELFRYVNKREGDSRNWQTEWKFMSDGTVYRRCLTTRADAPGEWKIMRQEDSKRIQWLGKPKDNDYLESRLITQGAVKILAKS